MHFTKHDFLLFSKQVFLIQPGNMTIYQCIPEIIFLDIIPWDTAKNLKYIQLEKCLLLTA